MNEINSHNIFIGISVVFLIIGFIMGMFIPKESNQVLCEDPSGNKIIGTECIDEIDDYSSIQSIIAFNCLFIALLMIVLWIYIESRRQLY